MAELLQAKNYFTAAEIKTMNTKKGGTTIIVTPLVSKIAKGDRPLGVAVFTIISRRTMQKMKRCGYITAVADKKNVVTAALLADAMKEALAYGADVLVITGNDDNSRLRATGFGLGSAYTHAAMSSTQSNGGIGTGGFGWSRGSAGYEGRPWFQAFMFRAEK